LGIEMLKNYREKLKGFWNKTTKEELYKICFSLAEDCCQLERGEIPTDQQIFEKVYKTRKLVRRSPK